jgi:hypothetical protein
MTNCHVQFWLKTAKSIWALYMMTYMCFFALVRWYHRKFPSHSQRSNPGFILVAVIGIKPDPSEYQASTLTPTRQIPGHSQKSRDKLRLLMAQSVWGGAGQDPYIPFIAVHPKYLGKGRHWTQGLFNNRSVCQPLDHWGGQFQVHSYSCRAPITFISSACTHVTTQEWLNRFWLTFPYHWQWLVSNRNILFYSSDSLS